MNTLLHKQVFIELNEKSNVIRNTRMHSSRMRTARFSCRLGGGGVCLGVCPRGVCLDPSREQIDRQV